MAGKRLSDNISVELNGTGFDAKDAFVVCNENEDRKLYVLDLFRALANGTNLDDGIIFATKEQVEELIVPNGGMYKIENGQIKQLNNDDGKWYTISVSKSGGKTLSWGDFLAVSVDSNGKIQYPTNFVKANNLVEAEEGCLKQIKPGTGLIGKAYNGTSEQSWCLDEAYVKQVVQKSTLIRSDTGELVEMKCRVVNGIPQFYGKVIDE